MKTLNYTIDSTKVLVTDIHTLDILAEELIITINVNQWTDGMEIIISLLCRLANLGHFKHLGLMFEFQDRAYVESDSAKKVLIGACQRNNSEPRAEIF